MQPAVVDAAIVRVLERLRQLAQQVEAGREVQTIGASAFEEAIQAFGVGVVLEDQGRPLLRARELLHAQDAVVGDTVQQLEFPLRRAAPVGANCLGRSPGEGEDAHPPFRAGYGGMLGFPVLVRVRLQEELPQQVIGHTPLPLRGTNSSLLHRASECAGEQSVDSRRRAARDEACIAQEDIEDVRVAVPLRLRGEIHACASAAFESAPHAASGQKDDGFYEWPPVLGERLLRLQKADELLRFPVREQEGVVDQELGAVLLAAPGVGVPRDRAAPTLDLDQIDLVDRYHEQVDLVDAAVVGDELEVRPRAERLAVGEAGLDVVEGLALPGELRGSDLEPAGGFHCRSIASSGKTKASRRVCPSPALGTV